MKTIKQSKPKPVKGFYTLSELAFFAGCCTATLCNDIHKGQLKATRSNGVGGAWLIAQGDASTYLEQRKKNRR